MKFVEPWSVTDITELSGIAIVIASISFLVYKHVTLLQSHPFKEYVTGYWNWIDIIASAAAIISLYWIFLRRRTLAEVLSAFEMSNNNMFTNFFLVSHMDYVSNIFAALNVCITTLRIQRVLVHIDQFRLAQYTVTYAFRPCLTAMFLMLLVMIGFAMVFHLVLGSYVDHCSTFTQAFTLIMGISFGLAKEISNSVLDHGGSLAYNLYMTFFVVMRIFFLNLFVSILIVSFSKCRRRLEREKSLFSFKDFFVERILMWPGKSEQVRRTFHAI